MVAALDLTSIAVAEIDLQEGSLLVLRDVSWERYEAIVATLEERHRYRTVYLDGMLEVIAPMIADERVHRMIGNIVKELCDLEERDWEDFGSTTFRQKKRRAGLEPDTCLYVDENARIVRACMEQMDLSVYPPPDLAIELRSTNVIESDVTSMTTFEVYLRLKVPEVWVWQNKGLKIYLLQNGKYIESQQSLIFPNFPVQTLIPQLVEQALKEGTSKMLRQLRLNLGQG
jgi:Uma2 family endonuclease